MRIIGTDMARLESFQSLYLQEIVANIQNVSTYGLFVSANNMQICMYTRMELYVGHQHTRIEHCITVIINFA